MAVGILILRRPHGGEETIYLGKKVFQIGRANDRDLQLVDASVSREHAVIQRKEDGYFLQDKASRNGTRVNGVAIARHRLCEGDVVTFGDIVTVFHEIEEEQPEEACAKQVTRQNHDSVLFAPAEDATQTLSLSDATNSREGAALTAWQVTQLFSTCLPSESERVLRIVVENLAGIQDIKKVLLHTILPEGYHCAQWIRSGIGGVAIAFPEEKILEVAVRGEPLWLSAGKYQGKLLATAAIDAAGLPVKISGKGVGCLYLEGRDVLSSGSLRAAQSTADAISVAFTMWTQAQRIPVEGKLAAASAAALAIVGHSRCLRDTIRMAEKAATADATVLIRGETGTGKELIARLIQGESSRSERPFIPVHCSAIDETLLGSLLFGHEKGAFTGAVGLKHGLFEEADGGTLFLDEIGELSLGMQVKLLRVLQEGEFMRVGGTQPLHVNVRIIAATNRDLEKAVRTGTFRSDLYYRLKVIELTIPPLRDRREDIPELIQHYIKLIGSAMASVVKAISPDAVDTLMHYSWPGNVRELRNVIERAMVLAETATLTRDDLPPEMVLACDAPLSGAVHSGDSHAVVNLAQVEQQHIQRILHDCGGNKRLAAQRLGISRSSLYEKLGRKD
jgi:DNA-binding NtrC family response regulator